MNHLVALLIKNESTPKFFLINDPSSEEEAENLIKASNVEKEMIEKIIFIGDSPDPVFLKNLFNDNGELKLSENFEEDVMMHKVRVHRDMLLEKTDKPFLKALSSDDKLGLKKINERKQFLRDLTKKRLFKGNEIVNLFFNISDLIIWNPGAGYESPPKITISPPHSENVPEMLKMQIGSAGEQAEAVCSIRNGAIVSVTMKNWGSGYFFPPSITVEAPTSKDSKKASLSAVISNILTPSE